MINWEFHTSDKLQKTQLAIVKLCKPRFESIGTSVKVAICSKITPNLLEFRLQIPCHYHKMTQNAD